MIRPICAIAVCTLSVNTSLAAPNPVGDWVSHQNGGVFVSQDRKCTARLIVERRYNIHASKRDAVEFDGVYSSVVTWLWLERRRPGCTPASGAPKDMYFLLRAWGTDLSPSNSAGIYDARASFMHCTGDFCDDTNYARDPFSTRLDFSKDGYLLDLGLDRKTDPIRFQPFTERQKASNAEARTFLSLLERLNKADMPTFVDSHVDLSTLSRSRSDMISIFERYWDLRLSQHGSYVIVKAFDLEPAEGGWPQAEVLHLLVSHRLTDGTQHGEVFELLKVGGRWKLLMMQ